MTPKAYVPAAQSSISFGLMYPDFFSVFMSAIDGAQTIRLPTASATFTTLGNECGIVLVDQWLNADIWYATSKDGYKWKEQGPAVERGPQGAWDDFSVFTCNILVADGKYYLAYQAECMPDRKTYADDVVGMAWARSPRGPWTKLQEPILRPTKDAVLEGDMTGNRRKLRVVKDGSFDSKCVHDPGIVIFNGKYYLYYKGHGWTDRGPWNGTHPADTMWGVAIADKPTGPYTKSEYNPVTNSGHEVWVFPWKTGIAALVDFAGPEANTAQYSVESESIERALDTGWSNGADVRVDHGCLEIGVSE